MRCFCAVSGLLQHHMVSGEDFPDSASVLFGLFVKPANDHQGHDAEIGIGDTAHGLSFHGASTCQLEPALFRREVDGLDDVVAATEIRLQNRADVRQLVQRSASARRVAAGDSALENLGSWLCEKHTLAQLDSVRNEGRPHSSETQPAEPVQDVYRWRARSERCALPKRGVRSAT